MRKRNAPVLEAGKSISHVRPNPIPNSHGHEWPRVCLVARRNRKAKSRARSIFVSARRSALLIIDRLDTQQSGLMRKRNSSLFLRPFEHPRNVTLRSKNKYTKKIDTNHK